MEAFFHKIGVQASVISTSDEESMLDIAKACKIDLLAYYTESPDGRGLKDFISQMRECNPGLRVILLTQAEWPQDFGAAADISADEFVKLPIKPEGFLQRLAVLAKHIEANTAPAKQPALTPAAPAEIEFVRVSSEKILPEKEADEKREARSEGYITTEPFPEADADTAAPHATASPEHFEAWPGRVPNEHPEPTPRPAARQTQTAPEPEPANFAQPQSAARQTQTAPEPEPDSYAQPRSAARYPVATPEPSAGNSEKADTVRKNPIAAKKLLKIFGTVLVVIAIVFITVLAVTIIKGKANNGTPTFFGYRLYTVVSGSMKGSKKDSFDKGSLILVADIDPRDIRVGDVITFNRESKDQKVTTHRVAEIRKDKNGKLSFLTKGDANPAPDDAEVPADIVVGIVRAKVPRLGNVILFAQTKTGRFYALYLPGGAIVLYEIYVLAGDRLTRGRKRGESAEPEKDTNREMEHD